MPIGPGLPRKTTRPPSPKGSTAKMGAAPIPLPLGEGLGEGSPAAVPMSEPGAATEAALAPPPPPPPPAGGGG